MEASINLIDTSFNPENLNNYHLSLQLYEYSITVCITDLKQNITPAVWSINSKYSILNEKKNSEILTDLLKECTIPIKGAYKETSVTIANKQYSFIPNPLFDSSQLKKYIELNCGPLTNSQFKYESLEQENMTIAYAVPDHIIKILDNTLINYKITSHKKIFLDSVSGNFKSNDTELYINYTNKQLELLYFKGAKFHHGSTHEIGAPEDFLFFILNSCEHLNLNPQNIKLILLGAIKTGDKIHHLAFSYFEKIQFGTVLSTANLAPALHDIPKHYFYTAYKQHLCE